MGTTMDHSTTAAADSVIPLDTYNIFEHLLTLKICWFVDFNFWKFIIDFRLQWSFNTMCHSIHWYYCCCWLGDPSGHLENFRTFVDFENLLIFGLQFLEVYYWFSSSMIIQYYGSFNTFILLLLLLPRWSLWTLIKFNIFLTLHFHFF